jgi:glycosyltransferase involved in cell wall biosynthesis
MEADLVSIITPCYNAAPYLESTYKSIRAQEYQNWEWVVTNDSSTDDSLQILQQLQERDSRIKIFTQKNGGAAATRNNSIKEASGRFHAFLDADDLWFPDHLSTLIPFQLEKECALVYSNYEIRTDDTHMDFIGSPKVNYTGLLKQNVISCLTAIIDTSRVGKIYSPIIKRRNDLAMWLKVLEIEEYAYNANKITAVYRLNPGSLSGDKKGVIKNQYEFLRNTLGMNFFKSAYFLGIWAVNGFLKYRKFKASR